MLRRTPCIGTCSTTYGDLVCRGCKRFAHEIVQWNGFDAEQRRIVWDRLLGLRAGAVRSVLQIRDPGSLETLARRIGFAAPVELDPENLLYELLQRLRWREGDVSLQTLGVALTDASRTHLAAVGAASALPQSLLILIDREFYRRSVAQYERNYRIPAE